MRTIRWPDLETDEERLNVLIGKMLYPGLTKKGWEDVRRLTRQIK